MAWEDRNGNSYYYRKRRKGKQVLSEYVGAGLAGQLAEVFHLEDKHEAEYKRRELKKQKAHAQATDSAVGEVEKYTKAVMRACLLLAGYHTHKRQWRKFRT